MEVLGKSYCNALNYEVRYIFYADCLPFNNVWSVTGLFFVCLIFSFRCSTFADEPALFQYIYADREAGQEIYWTNYKK